MIEREIEREAYHTNGFLVDYIPNQKVMIKIDTLLQNVEGMLSKFEEKVSIVLFILFVVGRRSES